MIQRVAIDNLGNVMAFKFQSATNVIEADVDPSFLTMPIFTEQNVNRFYIQDGIVIQRTDDECKAQPQYNTYQDTQRHLAYTAESDGLFFQFQRGETTEAMWLAKVAEIKARYPKA